MKIRALLSIFLIITFLPVAGYASGEDYTKSEYDYEQRYDLLKGTGVINDTEILEDVESLTRAQFVSLTVDAANVVGYKKVPEKTFSDVLVSYKYYESIYTALEYGYISQGENFYPDDEITFEQATAILCRALGYTPIAEASGGYPDGYIKTAYEFSLFEDIEMSDDNKISFREAVNLIYNFVNADLLDVNFSDSGMTYEKASGKTLLSERYNIFKTEGVINANRYTDLLSADSGIRENEVKVDDVVYRDENSPACDYLGYYAEIYYRVDEKDDVNDIVYVTPGEMNTVKKIFAKDLVDCSNNVVNYDDGTGKIRKINVSPVMSFIVNGRMKLVNPVYLKSIKKGEMTFISNDGDSTCDVCIVSDYSTTIITGVSPTQQLVTCDNGAKIDFADKYFDNNIIKDGEKISFTELKTDDVLMICESEGPDINLRTILVSDKKIEDKIIGVNDKNIEIADSLYEFDTGINEKLKPGSYYKIYFDYYGNICHVISETSIVYGYLYKTCKYDGIDDTVEFMIFTENDRVVTLKVSEKVRLNGTLVNPRELIEQDSVSYVAPKQMIRYKVNSDAEIILLETAELIKIGSQQEKKAIEDGKFRISYDDTSTWRSSSKTFDGMFYADKLTKVFVIPDEDDISTFKVEDIGSFSGDSQYTITAYDADDYHVVKVIVIKELTRKINHNSKFMILTGKGMILNSEEDGVPRLGGYWSGDKMVFPVKISEDLTEEQVAALEPGDLILFTYDDLGNINRISTYKSEFYISSGRYSYFTVIGGLVNKIDYSTGRIAVNYLGDTNATYSDCCMIFNDKTAVYIYNRKYDEYHIASADDIMSGDKIYINSSYLTCKEIIIIR